MKTYIHCVFVDDGEERLNKTLFDPNYNKSKYIHEKILDLVI